MWFCLMRVPFRLGGRVAARPCLCSVDTLGTSMTLLHSFMCPSEICGHSCDDSLFQNKVCEDGLVLLL